MNALTEIQTESDHRELFPLSEMGGAAAMRRIGVVCRVQEICGFLWVGQIPSGSNTLEQAIDYKLRRDLCSHEARLAVYDYFAAYAPLDTQVRSIDIDTLRAFVEPIKEDAAEDEDKYRARMKQVAA